MIHAAARSTHRRSHRGSSLILVDNGQLRELHSLLAAIPEKPLPSETEFECDSHASLESWLARTVPEQTLQSTITACKDNGITSVEDLVAIRNAGLSLVPTVGIRPAADIELALRKQAEAKPKGVGDFQNGSSSQLFSRHAKAATMAKDGSAEASNEDLMFAEDISSSITSQLQMICLTSALLSSWGATVYGGDAPPDDGMCFGPSVVRTSIALFWVSLGFFFVCICSSLMVVADLDGIPTQLMLGHLRRKFVRYIYQIPEFSIVGGVIFLAAAYTLDVGERAGCELFYFGMVAAPCFVGGVGMLSILLRRDRAKLNDMLQLDGLPLGRSYFATWRDRLDAHDKELLTQAEAETSCTT